MGMLMFRLEELRSDTMLTKWIADLQNGKTSRVNIGHLLSEIRHITSGVP